MSQKEKTYSTIEAARILGITPMRVFIMCKKGNLKAEKCLKQNLQDSPRNYVWRIPASELTGWIKVKHGTRFWLERENNIDTDHKQE